MRYFVLALVMAVCGFSALAEDDYFPMHIGDEWMMEETGFVPNSGISNMKIREKMENTIEQGGKSYFFFETLFIGKDEASGGPGDLIRKDATGVHSLFHHFFSPGGTIDDVEQLDCPFPLIVGSTWQKKAGGKAQIDVTLSFSIVGFERVTIADKTYEKCLHIRCARSDDDSIEDTWRAPGIGKVKCETAYPNDPDKRKLTVILKAFKPGK